MAHRSVSVLLVERSELVAEALADIFMESGLAASVVTASGVAQALEAAAEARPDLIVLDAWLGRHEPEKIIRALADRSPRSSVIVMASDLDPSVERRMRRAGAVMCVDKDAMAVEAARVLGLAGVAR